MRGLDEFGRNGSEDGSGKTGRLWKEESEEDEVEEERSRFNMTESMGGATVEAEEETE